MIKTSIYVPTVLHDRVEYWCNHCSPQIPFNLFSIQKRVSDPRSLLNGAIGSKYFGNQFFFGSTAVDSAVRLNRLFKAKLPVSFTTDCFLLSYLTVAQRNLCLLLSFHLSVLLNLFSSIFAAFCCFCGRWFQTFERWCVLNVFCWSMIPDQRQTAPSPPLAGLHRHPLVLSRNWEHWSLSETGRGYTVVYVPMFTVRIIYRR